MRHALVLVLLLVATASAKDAVQKQKFKFAGADRTYYLFVAENSASPAPLLLLLHGSGSNGRAMVDAWKDLASKEGLILVAPDSRDARYWNARDDNPSFLHAVIEDVRARYAVNRRRMYLFGHSAGARFALLIALWESEYFAAAAIDAGALPLEQHRFIALAARKIPVRMTIGDDDQIVLPQEARNTRDALLKSGLPVQFSEIPHHSHSYWPKAADINAAAWSFLKAHELSADPQFQVYEIKEGKGAP